MQLFIHKIKQSLQSHIQYHVIIVGASIANRLFQVSSLIRNTAILVPLGKEGISFKISVLTEAQFSI